jgi:hypothetical protein
MPDSVNYSVTGTNINAQNIAVGENASIVQTDSSQSLTQPLAQLRSAIDAIEAPALTKEALTAAHEEIAHELDAPEPDKGKLLAKLMSLSALAGPAGTVVSAAAALAQAITVIL